MKLLRVILAHVILQVFIIYFCKGETTEQKSYIEFARKELGDPKDKNSIIEQIFFPPDLTAKKVLLGLIQNEKEKIFIAQYRFNDSEVLKAIIDAKRRGVEITLIVDQSAIQDKFQKIKDVFDAKIKTYYYARPFSIMHHKLFIFHNNFCERPIVVTGSVNATPTGYTKNWENMFITGSEKIVDECIKCFKRLKKETYACVAALFDREPVMVARNRERKIKEEKITKNKLPKPNTVANLFKTAVSVVRKIR